jgi:hypothetical protein
MLKKDDKTTAKQDATRTNTARGVAHTATDHKAENASVRSKAARPHGQSRTADHLGEGEKSDTVVGPAAGPPLPPPAPIPVANAPETVHADDVATRKAMDDAEEESSKRDRVKRGVKEQTAKAKLQAKGKAFAHDHDRHECLMHCAATILSRSITTTTKDAVTEALAIEDELHKQLEEQTKKAESEDKADDADHETK